MKKHNFLFYVGLVMLLTALGLVCYNVWESHQAAKSVTQILHQMNLAAQSQPCAPKKGSDTIPTVTALGNQYIGILEIPCLEMQLPIMSNSDMQKLKTAPGRYHGSAANNDLVIAGHNYRSHFAHLNQLKGGEQVIFTDADNNRIVYEVIRIEELDQNASDEMISGNWDLSLFTCTLSGASRLTVRCKRAA